MTERPKHRWCQFRVKTLLVLVAVCALLVRIGMNMNQKRLDRFVIAEIMRLRGSWHVVLPHDPGSHQHISLPIYTPRIIRTELRDPQLKVDDDSTVELAPLAADRVLLFGKHPGVTMLTLWDEQGRSQTVEVRIGLDEKAQGWSLPTLLGDGSELGIFAISLERTAATDADLTFLRNVPHLESLNLCGTKVTEKGVAALRKALPNCRIRR